MRLCTTRQMRSIDRRTIDDHGLSGFELMERAGCRVAETAQRLLGGVVGRTIEVVCGKGNNGGDGFVAARYLHQWGASVGCYVLSGRPAVSGDAARHLDRLEEAGLAPSFLADLPFRLPDRSPALIIDALLGTGMSGQPRDPYGPAIAEINRCPAPVLSVDIPSGLATGCGYPQSRSREDWTCVRADHTHQWGASVGCYVLSGRPAVSGDAARHLDRLEEAGLSPSFLADLPFRLPDRSPALIIDALLGTGMSGQPRDPYGPAIAEINRCPAPVLSVDIPSGLATGCGYPQSRSREDWTCVRADHTLAIGLMKVDLATYPGRAWSGSVEVADIGFPDEAIEAEGIYLSMPERNEMAGIIPAYMPGDHKGSRGRVAVVAGSAGMAGAATLASRAALRSGAGMVMLGSPVSLMGALTAKHTEVMLRGLAETAEGTLSLAALPGIESLLSWADVLAIGPGLTRQEETSDLVRRVVSNSTRPVVIDADGVNAFSGHGGDLAGVRPEIIMTPHVFELSRLTDMPVEEIENDRIEAARQTAGSLEVTLVLKGAATVVASPCGRASVNPTGNPGMATAGSGDVLTGILAALLGQGLGAWEAARLGVYLHGLAGDLGAEVMGPHSLVAGDLTDHLPEAFLRTSEAQDSP